MITHIIVWIEIEHIIHLLLFGYPIIIILIKFEERAVELWNICLVKKQRKNGAFLIPGVSKIGYMWLIPKAAEKPTDGRRKGNKK